MLVHHGRRNSASAATPKHDGKTACSTVTVPNVGGLDSTSKSNIHEISAAFQLTTGRLFMGSNDDQSVLRFVTGAASAATTIFNDKHTHTHTNLGWQADAFTIVY